MSEDDWEEYSEGDLKLSLINSLLDSRPNMDAKEIVKEAKLLFKYIQPDGPKAAVTPIKPEAKPH